MKVQQLRTGLIVDLQLNQVVGRCFVELSGDVAPRRSL